MRYAKGGRVGSRATPFVPSGCVYMVRPKPEPVCTCHPVPEQYWTTHYGATEPGSTLEPDFDCPVHFPPDAEVISNASVRIRDTEKEVRPISTDRPA